MSFKYLASPYTGSQDVMLDRFHKTKAALAELLARKLWCYSPIVHCHQMAQDHSLPTTFDFWIAYNHAMIDSSAGVLILLLPGWDKSKGVAEEIEYARSICLPIETVCPSTFFIEAMHRHSTPGLRRNTLDRAAKREQLERLHVPAGDISKIIDDLYGAENNAVASPDESNYTAGWF